MMEKKDPLYQRSKSNLVNDIPSMTNRKREKLDQTVLESMEYSNPLVSKTDKPAEASILGVSFIVEKSYQIGELSDEKIVYVELQNMRIENYSFGNISSQTEISRGDLFTLVRAVRNGRLFIKKVLEDKEKAKIELSMQMLYFPEYTLSLLGYSETNTQTEFYYENQEIHSFSDFIANPGLSFTERLQLCIKIAKTLIFYAGKGIYLSVCLDCFVFSSLVNGPLLVHFSSQNWRFLAPETILLKEVSRSSILWVMSMLFFAILSSKQPFEENTNNKDEFLSNLLTKNMRPHVPDGFYLQPGIKNSQSQADRAFRLLSQMWALPPTDRLEIEVVYQVLLEIASETNSFKTST
jgi:hypothetical protein